MRPIHFHGQANRQGRKRSKMLQRQIGKITGACPELLSVERVDFGAIFGEPGRGRSCLGDFIESLHRRANP